MNIRATSIIMTVMTTTALASGTASGQSSTRRDLALYRQELDMVKLLLDAGDATPPGEAIIDNVRLVDPRTATVSEGGIVHVRDGRVMAIGDEAMAGIDAGPNAARIDGDGRFLVPGLADMHVHHTVSASQHLLHTLHGITTVREMVGFPWLLQWREQSRRDAWIAPSLIVAGHIISSSSGLGMFATVVKTEDDARRVVREHAAAGYDAIKVHNALRIDLFDAVADETRKVGLPLVGHIPHRISVTHALESGLWTAEHFKGYIIDSNLTLSTEDWVTPTAASEVWNTPTFYTTRSLPTATEATAWAAGEEAPYVPVITREWWMNRSIPDPNARLTKARRGQDELRTAILQRLMPVTDRFLVGSDSGGGYAFMVPGFAMFVEMRLMHEAGLDADAVLRGATTFAAEAARRVGEFGAITVGARADLVLLNANPLEQPPTTSDVHAVMLRGRWFSAETRASLLEHMRTICAERPEVIDPDHPLSAAWVSTFVEDIRRLRERGYIFPTHHVQEITAALRATGHPDAADSIAD